MLFGELQGSSPGWWDCSMASSFFPISEASRLLVQPTFFVVSGDTCNLVGSLEGSQVSGVGQEA